MHCFVDSILPLCRWDHSEKGPGPPLDRWTGTDVTTLLPTVVVPQRMSEKKRRELEN